MEKYKVMLIYTFLFFSASMTLIILGTNLTYEVTSARSEIRPAKLEGDKWAVQRVTKGVPPVRIITKTDWRQGTSEDYVTSTTRQIHWLNIFGVVMFSTVISGALVFIGTMILTVATRFISQNQTIQTLRRQTVKQP